MQRQLIEPAGAQRVHAAILPDIGAVAPMPAKLEAVDMRRGPLLERKDQLMAGTVESPHPAFFLHPDDQVLGDRIFLVQLADAPLIDMDLLYWSRHFRNMPGQGDLPVVDFMRAVAATGYAGPLSLEIFNDQFRGGSPKSISVDGRRSLVYLMDRVVRAEPQIAIDVPTMPDRVGAKGVEFIEFADDESEAEELADLLLTLGFARTARHKNKDVTLYRQGGINIVINTEKEGLAHSSYLMHGASAYAIGLKVDDAAATVTRAKMLGADPFEQRHGPGELAIPAIRGVGGGIIYFLDDKSELCRVRDIEFDPVDPAPGAGAGLTRVDHVAQTMSYEEMLTWLLFYTSIFRAQKLPMVDVIDPGGVVRSQVIESDDKALRLTLNGAENSKTEIPRSAADGSRVTGLIRRSLPSGPPATWSATKAPRSPMGLGLPAVVSMAV